MNKFLKYSFVALFSIYVILLLSFKLIIPVVVNLDSFKPEIVKEIKAQTSLNLNIERLKLATTWGFGIVVKATDVKVYHKDSYPLLKLKEGEVKISVLPILFKKLKFNSIKLINPEIYIYRQKNGKYKLEEIIQSQEETDETALTPLIKGTKILISNYKATLNDNYKQPQKYILKGEKINVSDLSENKHIKFVAIGSLFANNQTYINYDLKINSQLPKITDNGADKEKQNNTLSPNTLKQLVETGLRANISSDLKIKDINKIPQVNGYLGLENLTILMNSKQIPKSYLRVDFDKYQGNINSKLFLNQKQNLSIKGIINPIKKPYINADIISSDINLSSLKDITHNVLKISGSDTNIIKPLKISGNLKADFHIEANKSTLLYKGLTEITNLNIQYDSANLVKDFNSTITNQDQRLIIENTNGLITNSLLTIKGFIEKNTHTDITAEIPKLSLNEISKFISGLKNNKALKKQLAPIKSMSGYIGLKANLKGKITNIKPNILMTFDNASITPKDLGFPLSVKNGKITSDAQNVKIDNVTGEILGSPIYINGDIKNIQNNPKLKVSVKMPKLLASNIRKLTASPDIDKNTKILINNLNPINGYISMNADIENEKINGNIKVHSISAYDKKNNVTYSIPNGEVTFNDNNATIKNIRLNAKHSFILTNGSIENIIKEPKLSIFTTGSINSNDLISLNPEFKNIFKPNSKFPLLIKISGKQKKLLVKGQITADKNTELSMLNIAEIDKQNKLINVDATVTDKSIKFENSGLFTLSGQSDLSKDMKSNLSSASKIINLDGQINNINANNASFNNLKLSMPKTLRLKLKEFNNTTANIKSNLNINGPIEKPQINGEINLSKIKFPLFELSSDQILVNFSNSSINATSKNTKIANSDFVINALIEPKLIEPYIIKDIKITSNYIDIDKINEIFASDSSQKAQKIPLVIKKGTFIGNKIKSGEIIADKTRLSFSMNENNNIVIPNLYTSSMNGEVTGKVTYNLLSGYTKANLEAKKLNAETVARVILLQPGVIQGTLNSKANISTSGFTPEQQTINTKGNITFEVKNGHIGTLGNFAFYLNAANLISSNFISLNIDQLVNVIQPKNTGHFETLRGRIYLNNGMAKIEEVTSQGKNLSLYITGETNIINNTGNLTIYGRTSKDVVDALGPLGEVSIEKLLGKIPHFGGFAKNLLNIYYTDASQSNINKIPELSNEEIESKLFKVYIKGNLQNPRSVKTFKWINERD